MRLNALILSKGFAGTFVADERDGPIQPGQRTVSLHDDNKAAVTASSNTGPIESSELTSRSALLRSLIHQNQLKFDSSATCCVTIGDANVLGRRLGLTETLKACPPTKSHNESFTGAFLQSHYVVRRAESMTSDQRAALKKEMMRNYDQWPDSYKSEDADAGDSSGSFQRGDALVEAALKSARERITNRAGLIEQIDLKTYLYPLIAKHIAAWTFLKGCPRNWDSRLCPLEWTLKVNNEMVVDDVGEATLKRFQDQLEVKIESVRCVPPIAYNGLCTNLDITELVNRTDSSVRKRMKSLSEFCWFEFPCASTATRSHNACPDTYRELRGVKTKDRWCLALRDGEDCSPVLRFDPSSLEREQIVTACSLQSEGFGSVSEIIRPTQATQAPVIIERLSLTSTDPRMGPLTFYPVDL